MTKDPKAAPSAKPDGAKQATPATTTKSATVLALLRREQGSTLAELVEATAWHATHCPSRAHRPSQEGPYNRAAQARGHQLLPPP